MTSTARSLVLISGLLAIVQAGVRAN